MKPNRKKVRDIGFYVLLAVIIIAIVYTMNLDSKVNEVSSYSELADLFENEKVESFRTEGNTIILQVRTGNPVDPVEEQQYSLYSFSVFYQDFGDLIREQHQSGILKEYDYTEGFVMPWWASFIPYLIIMLGAMGLWYFMMNRAGGGGGAGGFARFSKARTKLGSDEKDKKTFMDVAGCDEEKAELADQRASFS